MTDKNEKPKTGGNKKVNTGGNKKVNYDIILKAIIAAASIVAAFAVSSGLNGINTSVEGHFSKFIHIASKIDSNVFLIAEKIGEIGKEITYVKDEIKTGKNEIEKEIISVKNAINNSSPELAFTEVDRELAYHITAKKLEKRHFVICNPSHEPVISMTSPPETTKQGEALLAENLDDEFMKLLDETALKTLNYSIIQRLNYFILKITPCKFLSQSEKIVIPGNDVLPFDEFKVLVGSALQKRVSILK